MELISGRWRWFNDRKPTNIIYDIGNSKLWCSMSHCLCPLLIATILTVDNSCKLRLTLRCRWPASSLYHVSFCLTAIYKPLITCQCSPEVWESCLICNPQSMRGQELVDTHSSLLLSRERFWVASCGLTRGPSRTEFLLPTAASSDTHF